MMNILVLTKYRPKVDEYENGITHGNDGNGRTLCGREISGFRVWERTSYAVDCKRCLASIAKNKQAW